MKRIVYLMFLSILALVFSTDVAGQVPNDQIQGPHTQYEGPY